MPMVYWQSEFNLNKLYPGVSKYTSPPSHLNTIGVTNLLPKFNEEIKKFVEPYLPNNKLGIIHLASGIWDGDKDMRLNKEVKINIKTLENKILSKSLRFGH